jgi:hypothetical protein
MALSVPWRKFRSSIAQPSRAIAEASRLSLVPVRKLVMMSDEYSSRRVRSRSSGRRVFNLDLHVSVIRDLQMELQRQGASITSWSISGHNHVFRRWFTKPDPVAVVNASTWKTLDQNVIDRFQDRYRRFLNSFDGYVVTHTPVFAQLFQGLDRPLLVMASTRYEAPYTDRHGLWESLNEYLKCEVINGRMVLAANNRGDVDYLEYFIGIKPRYVPSLCDYLGTNWSGRGGDRVVQARSVRLAGEIVARSRGQIVDIRSSLPRHFTWAELTRLEEVLVIPYNISTMTLFELATAGVPVTVPSIDLLSDLYGKYEGVLDQLTWHQIYGLEVPREADNPCNSHRPEFLHWWLRRSDFYDQMLMPNVRTVDSWEEAACTPHPVTTIGLPEWSSAVRDRNQAIAMQREVLVQEFLSLL